VSIRHTLRKVNERDGFGSYPRLVIEVEGIDDVYRIARALEGHQVEFSRLAGQTLHGLDRRWPGIVRALVRRMGPSDGWRYPGRIPRTRSKVVS
jgi:hypothetical protein